MGEGALTSRPLQEPWVWHRLEKGLVLSGNFSLRTEPRVCEEAEEPVPGFVMLPIPQSKWEAFNSPYCSSQPEMYSSSYQSGPDCFRGIFFS